MPFALMAKFNQICTVTQGLVSPMANGANSGAPQLNEGPQTNYPKVKKYTILLIFLNERPLSAVI